MFKKPLLWLAITIALVLLGFSAFRTTLHALDTARNQNASRIIKEIRFDGIMNTRPQEVLNLISLREGQNFTEALLNDTLKKLYSLDMFHDVKADITMNTDGMIITFQLEENPYIRNIKFDGAVSISHDDLVKAIGISDGSYLSEAKKNRSISAIQKKYIDDGFIEASVSYQLQVVDVKKNIFDLLYKVSENKKIVIEKMVVTGNKKLTEGEIKGVMKTKERFFIFASGVLKQVEFDGDRETIKTFYQHKGFLDADIKRFEWKIEELDQDKHKAIVVYLDLSEGEIYYTGKIRITGNSIFTTDELMGMVNMKEGEIYDRVKIDMIRYAIFNQYSDNGHVYANVSLSMNKNTTNKVVDTELVITEGPLAHIENVSVSGNTKTQTYVVKREFLFKEGELYVQRKVRQTQEKLMQTQFFSDVKVNWLPGSAEGLIDLDMGVEEQRTGMITFGLGYGTESGFNASVQLAEKNLFGTGRVASIKGTYGQNLQSVELSFQEPWLFGNPLFAGISFGFSRYIYNNLPMDSDGDGIIDGTAIAWNGADSSNSVVAVTNSDYYLRDTFTLGGKVIQQFFIFWSAYLGLSTTFYHDWLDSKSAWGTPLLFSTIWQTNTNLIASLAKTSWTFQNMLSLGLALDSTGNPLGPLYGDKLSWDNYLVGGLLQGDIHFIKTHVSIDHYWNPFWKIVLVLHGSSDVLFPQITGQFNYNLADMLYFDGSYEMRGWLGYPVRSESKLFLSSELRFQIIPDPSIWGVVFFDLGNLWGKWQQYAPFTPDNYLFSFGIGVQVNIPMIPIRFYMARTGYYNGNSWNLSDPGHWQLYSSDGLGDFWKDWRPVLTIQGLF